MNSMIAPESYGSCHGFFSCRTLVDWVGSVNPEEAPALAEGGLAFGPTVAMVGDNARALSDPEVIAPLSKLKGMMGGREQTIIVNLDGRQIHRTRQGAY